MLSERGSMIVPVAHEVVGEVARHAELQLGGTRFVRKQEHHFTVLNYGIGKHIAKLSAAAREEINTLAKSWTWHLSLRRDFFHLVQDAPGKPRLQTIVVLADAAIARFYAELRSRAAGWESPALVEALAFPPPPHITLYTSDPDGRQGIGLNRVSEFEGAISRAAEGDGPGLRAYRLHPDVVCYA
jgi:hypothetical protein